MRLFVSLLIVGCLTACATGKIAPFSEATPLSFDGYQLSRSVPDGQLVRVQGYLMADYLISDREGECRIRDREKFMVHDIDMRRDEMKNLIGRHVVLEGVFRTPDDYVFGKGGLTVPLLRDIHYFGVLEEAKVVAQSSAKCLL